MQIPIPREHGAWAMLYAPAILAIAITGKFPIPAFLFLMAMTGVFFAHAPLFTLVRLNPAQNQSAEKFKQSRFWIAVYLALALAAGIPLVISYRMWLLVPAGVVFGIILAYQTYLTKQREEKSMLGEFLAIISLTASAPAMHYVIRGSGNTGTFLLWLLCILYFISSIFYVKMLVARVAKKGATASAVSRCVVYHLLLTLLLAILIWRYGFSLLLLIGYIPILFRSFFHAVRPPAKLSLLRVGVVEMINTLLFVVFVAAALRT